MWKILYNLGWPWCCWLSLGRYHYSYILALSYCVMTVWPLYLHFSWICGSHLLKLNFKIAQGLFFYLCHKDTVAWLAAIVGHTWDTLSVFWHFFREQCRLKPKTPKNGGCWETDNVKGQFLTWRMGKQLVEDNACEERPCQNPVVCHFSQTTTASSASQGKPLQLITAQWTDVVCPASQTAVDHPFKIGPLFKK